MIDRKPELRVPPVPSHLGTGTEPQCPIHPSYGDQQDQLFGVALSAINTGIPSTTG